MRYLHKNSDYQKTIYFTSLKIGLYFKVNKIYFREAAAWVQAVGSLPKLL